MFIQSFIPQPQRASGAATKAFLPRHAFAFAQSPDVCQPTDSFQASEAAKLAGLRSGPENLMLFGGDRKTAIGTLVASGAKAENPKLGFFKNLMRKVVGGTKTSSKKISAQQTIATKVKVKNFNLKALRLTTKGTSVGNEETLRHVDFNTKNAAGKTAQVKDVGGVIAKGSPTRMFEQDIKHATAGEQAQVTNSYFDPKSGQKFLQTTEVANRIEKDKMGTMKSHKDRDTYRQIDVLGADGKANQRYVFDYGGKSIRLESLSADGQITCSQNLSKKTDYFSLVERLSFAPPSAQAATAAPATVSGGGAA